MPTGSFVAQASFLALMASAVIWFVVDVAPKASKRSMQWSNIKIEFHETITRDTPRETRIP